MAAPPTTVTASPSVRTTTVSVGTLLCCLLFIDCGRVCTAFTYPSLRQRRHLPSVFIRRHDNSATALAAAGGKKKRRRRKDSSSPSSKTTATDKSSSAPTTTKESIVGAEEEVSSPPMSFDTRPLTPRDEVAEKEESVTTGGDTASPKKFAFDMNEAIALGVSDADDADDIAPAFASSSSSSTDLKPLPKFGEGGAMQLPDIKDTVKKKKTAAEVEEDVEESQETKEKIKRGDTAGLKKLLEIEPNADTDLSYFEDNEYGTVSILLGEGAKPFLGIPTGPLQVGHFIGALGILLMAFVQYPGFPLTNLPSPLRGALQGGLASVYAINGVLAVLAAMASGDRGQPAPLWALKTFTVGGLAYDQLMQIPTTQQLEAAKSKKGKRALKRNK